MKRAHPDPQNVYIAPRPLATPQPQYPIFVLPPEIIRLVLQCIRFKDVASFSQTCERFYKIIHNDEGVWSALFLKHFPNLPRFEPLLSWRTECELQRRCTRNIIAGLHSFHAIPIGQSTNSNSKASCIALDETDNILIGYDNGAVTILNPKTKETEQLCCGETSPDFNDSIRFLICEEGLYITGLQQEVKVWDAKTKKMVTSFGVGDNTSHIVHMKFVEGKLLVSSAHGYGISAPTTIRIWDPKSIKIRIIQSFDQCPSDIALCGKTFIAAFEFGGIHAIDLESQVTQVLKGAPSTIYALSGKILFLCDKNRGKIYIYSLDDPKNPSEIYLWADFGIPSGFTGEHISDRSRCSLEELSLFFNLFLSEEFEHFDSSHRNKITRIIPQQVYYDIPCVFHRGKIYYFCSDKEAILCIDFTASHEAILQQLVQMLERNNRSLYYAVKIIKRMPKAVQDAIEKNYPETSQAAVNIKVLKRTQNFKDELFELVTILDAPSEVSAAKTSYTDKNCLRQAILKYLNSAIPTKPAS